MSNNTVTPNNLYITLKEKAANAALVSAAAVDEPMSLDDTERTRVLSPGRLVSKRFFRNRLALVGLFILLTMFMFAFAGPIFYPYSQTQIFYKNEPLHIDYASASEKTVYSLYQLPGTPEINPSVYNRFNSYIAEMKAAGVDEDTFTATDGVDYTISKLGDGVYVISTYNVVQTGTLYIDAEVARTDRSLKSFIFSGEELDDGFKNAVGEAIDNGIDIIEYDGREYTVARSRAQYVVTLIGSKLIYDGKQLDADFQAAVEENLTAGEFVYNGLDYVINSLDRDVYGIYEHGDEIDVYLASTFVFNAFDVSVSFSEDFMRNAVYAIYNDGAFEADGEAYLIDLRDDDIYITDSLGNDVAELGTYTIRRYSGQDTLSVEFKNTTQDVIEDMQATFARSASFVFPIQRIDDDGRFVFDETGAPVLEDTEIIITSKATGEYVLRCDQITYLMDIFAPPSQQNWFGTDGDAMDILARMMYGGRISLMVGFIVVFLEIIIGVILGGISGFFGKWVDMLIMRMVDVFYCIPFYPILIILGALFDEQKMDAYQRLMWMMVALGVFGWAPIARLVRGQILMLREQEFMHAQEATGTSTRRRIFRHLVPNVMPQLIVYATMGVGSVIITESTLSFLGLGVRHPLATWGTMINSVTTSSEDMIRYTYIWVPVGFLICLTVIAFNFVGDGLRDAFDPKMKR